MRAETIRQLYRFLIFVVIGCEMVCAGKAAFAQTSVMEPYPYVESFTKQEWKKSSLAAPKDLEWFQDAKFGMMFTWGPVTLTGEEISFSRRGNRWPDPGTGDIPVAVYDNLYKRFNPVNFNADEWVQAAQRAGARYIVFIAKHADGFCLWDTKTTPYNIMNSPFHRDVLKEVAEAAHKAHMPLGVYFSQRDWYYPDYFGPDHQRYIKYMHQQVRELLTNYGSIRILWFDAWPSFTGGFKAKDWKAEELYEMARKLQPGIIINNRSGLPGDYDTPEAYISTFQIDRPWEHDFPLTPTQWAWTPNGRIESTEEILNTLVRCAVGGGNALLNIGPMPDGQIQSRQVARLNEIGEWLRKYGESIYGTRGGPFISDEWGGTTWRGDKIYVHILGWSGVREKGGGREAWSIDKVLRLPPITQKITDSKVLTGGSATVTQEDDGIEIQVPTEYRNPIDTIIVLTLDSPVAENVRPNTTGPDRP